MKNVMIALVAGFVIMAGVAGYFYWELMKVKKNPNVAAQQEVDALVAKVSQLIVLPTD